MQVFFTSRDADGSQLRDLAVRRVQFVLRRLTWLVPRATVQLSDVNGPRGGVDKRCRLQFKTDGGGTVVITSIAHDWRGALDGALARAGRALMRLWRRNQPPHAGGRRALAFDRRAGA
jgi:hypothetical protein